MSLFFSFSTCSSIWARNTGLPSVCVMAADWTASWRPPGNRTPSSEEVALMWPFLRRHIQLKAPKVIFALGGSSAKLLLNTTAGILKLRGQVKEIDFGEVGQANLIPVLPSLHPAYLLRAPKMKQQAFYDLLALKSMCRE